MCLIRSLLLRLQYTTKVLRTYYIRLSELGLALAFSATVFIVEHEFDHRPVLIVQEGLSAWIFHTDSQAFSLKDTVSHNSHIFKYPQYSNRNTISLN